MKFKFFIVYLFLVSAKLLAQDTIIKNNGEKILSKVLEITTKEVKYKRFGFMEGPLYTEYKSSIKQIIFANGVKETIGGVINSTSAKQRPDYFESPLVYSNKIEERKNLLYYQGRIITENQMHSILMNTDDKEIRVLAKKTQNKKGWQYIWVATLPAAIATECMLYNRRYFNKNTSVATEYTSNIVTGIFAVGIFSFPGISTYIGVRHRALKKKVIKLYNEKY